jgi:glycosyltransferase involved in cell wall biosynthesis
VNLQVVHFVRDLDLASGGPSRSVPALAENQARLPGVTVQVRYRERGEPRVPLEEGRVEYRPQRGRFSNPGRPLEIKPSTVFHLHGLWSPSLHLAARSARQSGIPYLVSTRGMLAEWALRHRPLRKRVAWRLYQRRDLGRAACLLASSEFEQRDVQGRLPDSRVEVLPNGCESRPGGVLPDHSLPGGADVRWALAMGRLHPVKGYAELIEAWSRVRPPGWRLAIAGPDEGGYRARLEALVRGNRLTEEILFLGEVDDTRKWALLDRCEVFLAPSRTENFGMAIAEALQSGRPVITTTGTPWRELVENDCGWWIPPEQAALEAALAEAAARPAAALRQMGERGRKLIRDNYTWEQVAASSVALYRAILQEHHDGTR